MNRILTQILLIITASSALAAEPILNSDGEVGYVRLPSAQMPTLGETSFTYYSFDNYEGRRLQFQASNRLSLSAFYSSNAKGVDDNGFDVKLRILDEGQYLPSLSIGFHDLFGIGPRSAEYLVSTKNIGPLEASLGLGWGALSGSESVFENGERPAINDTAFSTDHFFSGSASLFGGVAYRTPINGLTLSADYLAQEDGDDFGYGIQYRSSSRWGVGAYMRGEDEFGFAITLAGNPNRPITPQDHGQPIAVVPRALLGTDLSTSWYQDHAPTRRVMAESLEELIKEQGAQLESARISANTISVEITPEETLVTPKTIGRITRALAMNAPGSIETFEITIRNERGVPVSTTQINRSEYEAILEHPERTRLSFETAEFFNATPLQGSEVYQHQDQSSRFDYAVRARLNFPLSDEDNLSISPTLRASYRLTPRLSINANASLELFEVSKNLKPLDAPNRIRSDRALYRQDMVGLNRLTADYHYKIGSSLYGRLSAGLLETQFAGVDAEFIYAPVTSPLAFGLDIARVQKRDPENYFGLEDYQTTTGFATLYWDTGFEGVEASFGYGRFLGEDWGSDITLARKFRNGWRVEGALIIPERFHDTQSTEDLIPSVQVSIPLQWTLPSSSSTVFEMGRPVSTSDYGARLSISNPLYPTIRDYDQNDYELRWGGFWQ